MRDGLWGRVPAGYSPEARGLAQAGYAVLEVSHRGILGLGHRHWAAGRGRLDTAIAEDVVEALNRIAGQAKLERNRIAVWGTAFGGTMALRLAQMIPERVVCVVAIGPLLDLQAAIESPLSDSLRTRQFNDVRREFFGPDKQKLKELSPATIASKVAGPVLLVSIESRYPRSDDPAASVIRKMKAAGNPPEVARISDEKGWAETNAQVGVAAEKFLAKHFPLPKP